MTATVVREPTPRAPIHPSKSSRGLLWWGVGLGTAVMVWLTRGAWTAAAVDGGDVMFHLIRADVGLDELMARGRLHGWSTRMYLGTDLFLFYGPGFVWLMGLVRLMSLGVVDNATALTVVTLGGFLLLPTAVAFLARSLRLSLVAAGIVAVLTPVVSATFGVGMQAVFGVGLITQQVGAVLWIVCLGCLVRLVRHGGRRWTIATGVIFAAHALTSPVSIASLLLACAVVLFTLGRPLRPVVGRVGSAAVIALGLAAFWLIPALAHRDLGGGPTYWGAIHVPDLLGRILTGSILYPVGVGLAVVVSVVWMARRVPGTGRFLWVLPVAYLAAEALALPFDRNNVFVAAFLNHRALGLIGLVALLPLAWALEQVWLQRRRRQPTVLFFGLLALVVTLAQPGRLDAAKPQGDPIPAMHSAAEVLSSLVGPSARFAFAHEEGETRLLGVRAPHLWLAQASGTALLNGTGLETTRAHRAYDVGYRIPGVSPRQSSDGLIDMGATHVVTVSDELTDRLVASGLFRTAWQDDPLAILEVLPTSRGDARHGMTGRGLVSARLVKASNDNFVYLVEANSPTLLDLALAWSPHWKVTVDGAAVETRPTFDRRTQVAVAAGSVVIDLEYTTDDWERTGLLVSLVTLTSLVVWRPERLVHT